MLGGVLGSLELCCDSSSLPKLVAAPRVVKSAADGFLLHPALSVECKCVLTTLKIPRL